MPDIRRLRALTLSGDIVAGTELLRILKRQDSSKTCELCIFGKVDYRKGEGFWQRGYFNFACEAEKSENYNSELHENLFGTTAVASLPGGNFDWILLLANSCPYFCQSRGAFSTRAGAGE